MTGLTAILPLLSALSVWLFGREERRVAKVSNAFALATFAVALILLFEAFRGETGVWKLVGFVSFRLDSLSALMGAVVAFISLVVHFYSVRYMQDDPGYKRFFVLLDLTVFSILLTVSAENLFLLFTGWTLTGTFLYFLLTHNRRRPPAVRYGLWTFTVQRIGDGFLLIALLLLGQTFGSYEISELFPKIREEGEHYRGLLELAGLFVVLSAFAKSAQVPFHLWLPYTMEGPTPVSALMHAGIVNAGGFIVNRFAPVYYHAELGLHLAFLVGLLTAVLGALLMLVQADVKKALGYSTVGQMGYMMMEAGLGAFALAVYHLFAHGIFKATLFMGSGTVIHEARKDPNIPEDEIYKFFAEKELPPLKLSWLFFALVTVLVPFGVVVFAHLVAGVDVFKHQGAIILLFFGWITGAQTVFSIYRMGAKSPAKTLLLVLLSFTVVIMGYVVVGHAFERFLYPDYELIRRIYENAEINPLVFEVQILLLTAVAVAGWFYVYYAYQNGGVIIEKLKERYALLYRLLSKEFYVKELYERVGALLYEVGLKVEKLFRGL